MPKPQQMTVRNVEYGNQFFINSYQLVNFELNVPRYKNTVHWHNHFEMEILDAGNAIHLINGNTHPLRQHDAYLVTPADVHTLLVFPDQANTRVNITNISFNESAISEEIFNQLMEQKGPLHVSLSEETYRSFQDIIHLIKKGNSSSEAVQRQQRCLCDYLMLKFMEIYNSQTHIRELEIPEHSQKENKNYIYINKAISYIKYNFRSPKLTTQKVAKALFLTPNYFGELFFKHMNITCLDYIRKLKLNFAMSLLCQSNITVAEISERSGYASISYFIKDFKSEFGLTPQCYREQRKNSEQIPSAAEKSK